MRMTYSLSDDRRLSLTEDWNPLFRIKPIEWRGHDSESCYASTKVGVYGIYWGNDGDGTLQVLRGYNLINVTEPNRDAPPLSDEYLAPAYKIAQDDYDNRIARLLAEIVEPCENAD